MGNNDYRDMVFEFINNLPLPTDVSKSRTEYMERIKSEVCKVIDVYGLDKSIFIPVLIKGIGDKLGIWARSIIGEDCLRDALQTMMCDVPPQQAYTLADLLPECYDKAERIFQKAIGAGLMEQISTGFRWNESKQLLAYFAERMSREFHLSNKIDKDGNETTSWKPFEKLFGVYDLKAAKQNWMRVYTNFQPTGFERVDALF